ncbi:zinc finger, C3HC4 type (RING finger) protein (macronuclear) [Tetrahymena thermophila SB210]|uniref:RING-type E3 ubiquitin transferase n=1 Tax=Tetrahymena thermophila (strain SB210) TaxID=312017 RepID=I7MAN9_TETTS|nr:zinc finger, C3HC4 type (RING finger) protein [Tetrahymena thermophila SB210]EAS04963.2 zinc finger, C3HC4 type (RING finger) protein [Tetrahymena thermophila SB210]|eukprot:XP_001025208.2 zinc finger, C3HC4 type (RING finger) protein [Tetrahymena thermophila SB210]
MQHQQHDEEEQKSSASDIHALLEKFECTVCLEVAKEPVVTECGHLFCWPCIYKWLNQNNEYLVCPNCKNGIKKELIRPLYARNEDDTHQKQRDSNIPKRALPPRQIPQKNQNHLGGRVSSANLSLGVSFAGYGYFPSLYGLLNQYKNNITDQLESNVSPEVAKQPFLERFFYILCILCILFLVFCM